MREVKLPSGAIMKIHLAPFVDAKNLYQALLRELKEVQLNTKMELASVFKDLFCIGFSSPEIEAYLWKCFERCTYNAGQAELKMTPFVFESEDSRGDFMTACMEVAKDNIGPFVKSLYAEYGRMSAMIDKSQA